MAIAILQVGYASICQLAHVNEYELQAALGFPCYRTESRDKFLEKLV